MSKLTGNYYVISPAYGRDYSNAPLAAACFRSEQDFTMETVGVGGRYCSIRDFTKGTKVEIRFAKKAKLMVVIV